MQDPITNEVRYLGKSNNPKRRYQSHLWYKPKNTTHCYHWIKQLLKKDLKPIMSIIDEIDGEWEWLEQYWIAQLKQWGYKLTNLTDGGGGSYGNGKWNCKLISIYDLNGNYIQSFSSVNECAKYLKTSRESVSSCVQGRVKTLMKKYQIKEGISKKNIGKPTFKEYQFKNKPEVHWLSKAVKCNEDGKTFSSQTEAAKYYKIKITSINNVLNGRTKKTKCGKTFSRI